RLETFLSGLPAQPRAAFEFRHPTWFDDDVLELLRSRNCALCISDTDDMPAMHIDKTADWGYLRLRRVLYSEEHLKDWLTRVRQQNWNETFVFFKHEDEGTWPRLAEMPSVNLAFAPAERDVYSQDRSQKDLAPGLRLCRLMCGGGCAPPAALRLFRGYAPFS